MVPALYRSEGCQCAGFVLKNDIGGLGPHEGLRFSIVAIEVVVDRFFQLGHADPLPQALVLTAIVIGFGMTAYLVALALKAKGESGSDHVDAGEER